MQNLFRLLVCALSVVGCSSASYASTTKPAYGGRVEAAGANYSAPEVSSTDSEAYATPESAASVAAAPYASSEQPSVEQESLGDAAPSTSVDQQPDAKSPSVPENSEPDSELTTTVGNEEEAKVAQEALANLPNAPSLRAPARVQSSKRAQAKPKRQSLFAKFCGVFGCVSLPKEDIDYADEGDETPAQVEVVPVEAKAAEVDETPLEQGNELPAAVPPTVADETPLRVQVESAEQNNDHVPTEQIVSKHPPGKEHLPPSAEAAQPVVEAEAAPAEAAQPVVEAATSPYADEAENNY